MATLNRLFTFTPGTVIASSQVNSEFDQLIDLINGTATTTEVLINHSTTATTLTINETGGGVPFEVQLSGTPRSRITALGQFEFLSAVNPPIVTASQNVVTNLNCDLLDGVHESSLVRRLQDGQVLQGGVPTLTWYFDGTTNGAQLRYRDASSGDYWQTRGDAAASGVFTLGFYDGAVLTNVLTATQAGVLTDVNSETITTQEWVTARRTVWSFGVFYAGAVDPSINQGIWVVPLDEDSMQVERIRYVVQSGTPTGTTQIRLDHKNSAGVVQNTVTVNILSSITLLNSYDVDVAPDWALASGDFLQFTVVADGGHQDVSIHAQGTQSIF